MSILPSQFRHPALHAGHEPEFEEDQESVVNRKPGGYKMSPTEINGYGWQKYFFDF